MPNQNKVVILRFNDKIIDEIDDIVKDKAAYLNRSHFIRCAVIKLINSHKLNQPTQPQKT